MGQVIFQVTNSSNASGSVDYGKLTSISLSISSFSIKYPETYDLKNITLYAHYADGSSNPLTWNQVVVGPVMSGLTIDGNFVMNSAINSTYSDSVNVSYTEGSVTVSSAFQVNVTASLSNPKITDPTTHEVKYNGTITIYGSNLSATTDVLAVPVNDPSNKVKLSFIIDGDSIVAVIPTSLSDDFNLILAYPEGLSNSWFISLVTKITIDSITPNPVMVESDIVIKGKNFGTTKGSIYCAVNGMDLAIDQLIKSWSDSEIVLKTDSNMLGEGKLRVVSSDSLESDGIRLVVRPTDKFLPTITSVTPTVEGILPFQIKVYGDNLLPAKKVYIGVNEITLLNSWSSSKDLLGHALGTVTLVCSVPDGTTTGPVRVECDLGTAVGPVVDIQGPKINKVTPNKIKLSSSHVGPYNFIVEGEWLATTGTWSFNGVPVKSTYGSIKNRFNLAVASDLLLAGSNKITYARNDNEIEYSIDVESSDPAYDTTPKLFSCSVGEYGKDCTVTAVNTSMASCKLLLNNKEVVTTSWMAQQGATESNPAGTDYIKFVADDNVEPGTLNVSYIKDGVTNYTNVIEFKIVKPTITSISIDNGISGDEVVLTVTNAFGAKPSSKVYLGKTLCPVISWANDSIRIRIPDFAATGSLYLDTKNGVSNCFKFTVNVTSEIDPLITDLSKTEAYPGDEVKINGRDFGSRMGSVYIGSLKCVVNQWTDKQITFTVPDSAVTSNITISPYAYEWQVSGPILEILSKTALTDYRKDAFNPFIISCSPNVLTSGATVEVVGVHFDAGMTAKLGNTEVAIKYINKNTAEITVPADNSESILTLISSEGLISNSKQLKTGAGLPSITSVNKDVCIGSTLEIIGTNFGTLDSLGKYGVYFGDGPYSKAANTSIKTWSDTKVTVLLAPDIDYSYGAVWVVCDGNKSNIASINVSGESTAPTASPSLAYIADGYSMKADSGIDIEMLKNIANGSPCVINLSAEKLDEKSWSDLLDLIANGQNQKITVSGVAPDRTGNIKIKGVNGVTVITRSDDAPGTITLKGLTNDDLLLDASSSKLSVSYCDTFGVCRYENGTVSANSTKNLVREIAEGPGIKITRHTTAGDLFIDGINVGKEIITVSPKYDNTSFGVTRGNHSHGKNSTARYLITQEAKDFYSSLNKDVAVFGNPVSSYISETFDSPAESGKPAIYKIYPSKAPSGALVGVIGQNFTESSKIKIGNTVIEPIFLSSNELEFIVPKEQCKGNIVVSDTLDSNAMSFTHIFSWTDPMLQATITPIKALHYNEILANLKLKLDKSGRTNTVLNNVSVGGAITALNLYKIRHAIKANDNSITWTDDEIVSSTLVSAIHIKEMRWAVNNLRFSNTPRIVNNEVYSAMAANLDIVYHNFIDSYPNQPCYHTYYNSIADGYLTEN